MTITGGCFCGQLRYALAAEAPKAVRVCWCRDCQYIGAGTGTANAIFAKAGMTVTGAVAVFESRADSGAQMRRTFCPKCGTQVFSEAEPRPHLIVVRVGSLDEPERAKPAATIWTKSAPSWACIDADLPRFEAQPPPAG